MPRNTNETVTVELTAYEYDVLTSLVQYARQRHPGHQPNQHDVDVSIPFDLSELSNVESRLSEAALGEQDEASG